MMTVLTGTRSQLPGSLEAELDTYRHRIFVDTLGWDLPTQNGLERDQFDRPDTVYVVASQLDGGVCGCARLLPTTRAYLLAEVFPGLMNGTPLPSAPDVWELSRFSTKCSEGTPTLSRDEARRHFCTFFAAVVDAATAHGASRLITFTAVGLERIVRAMGVHTHRIGPPQLIDGAPVLALWIELDDQTRAALNMPLAKFMGTTH